MPRGRLVLEKDCSTYYRPYCAEKGWEPEDCDVDAVNADLAARWKGDSLLDSSLHATAAAAAARADGHGDRHGH